MAQTASSVNQPQGSGASIESKPAEYLKGRVSATPSPLLSGSVESLPEGTKVTLSLVGNLNSEVSQKGDEVLARIAVDVKDGEKILLPSGWYVHGLVSDAGGQKRLGRDGYVEVEFDKLVSPDGNTELPFKAKVSTRDNQLKSIAKVAAIDTGYVAVGALAGSIMSVQMTGIPVAIASEGYSVAIGAGVGATIGAIGALKRKGHIASLYPGDEMQLTLAEPLTLPGFNPDFLRRRVLPSKLADLDLVIRKSQFQKDPYDSHSRLLTVDLLMDNRSNKEVSFFDLAVVSDHNQRFYPSVLGDFKLWRKKVAPHTNSQANISFNVDSPKRKYWLVLLDRVNREELTRVPIN